MLHTRPQEPDGELLVRKGRGEYSVRGWVWFLMDNGNNVSPLPANGYLARDRDIHTCVSVSVYVSACVTGNGL